MTTARWRDGMDLLLEALAHEAMAKAVKARGVTPKFAAWLSAEARSLREQAKR